MTQSSSQPTQQFRGKLTRTSLLLLLPLSLIPVAILGIINLYNTYNFLQRQAITQFISVGDKQSELINSIIKGEPINEAENVATSTMTGIMGRISAYTGNLVRWKELVDEKVGSPWYGMTVSPSPLDFENGTVKAPADDVPAIPGKD